MRNAIELTQDLVAIDTVNPPGNELACANYIESILKPLGCSIEKTFFGENRVNLVVKFKGIDSDLKPLVLTGHMDVVPNGIGNWTYQPLSGEIVGDRLYGRGSSDMKSGIATMICAVNAVFSSSSPQRGVTLVLTGGEETACEGALHLVQNHSLSLGEASAIIVGEPTSNQLVLGHKGALFLEATTVGITAHSSMPDEGENAIYKAAAAIEKIKNFRFEIESDLLFGEPTINVGTINGGLNQNSVPDFTSFSIDIRSVPGFSHDEAIDKLKLLLGSDVTVQVLADMPSVVSSDSSCFYSTAKQMIENRSPNSTPVVPSTVTFFSDASVLKPHFDCPTIILGPGEPKLAHQKDEYCLTTKIIEAEELYRDIILEWCS